MSVHPYLSYDTSCAHKSGRGDKEENLTFYACHHEAYSTLRMCVCILNCVGDFGMDTGQPLVTSNGM